MPLGKDKMNHKVDRTHGKGYLCTYVVRGGGGRYWESGPTAPFLGALCLNMREKVMRAYEGECELF